MTAPTAVLAARLLERAEIELVMMRTYLAAALQRAVTLDNPVYDCVYLALAIAHGVPFVSADAAFRRKLAARPGSRGADVISLAEAVSRIAVP